MTLVLLWNLPAIGEPLVDLAPIAKKPSRLAYDGRGVQRITQYPTTLIDAPSLNPMVAYLALEFLNE